MSELEDFKKRWLARIEAGYDAWSLFEDGAGVIALLEQRIRGYEIAMDITEHQLSAKESELAEVKEQRAREWKEWSDLYNKDIERWRTAMEKNALTPFGWQKLESAEKRIEELESQAARLREALESIRDNSGNHSECPVGFCVERVAKEALRPESESERKPK